MCEDLGIPKKYCKEEHSGYVCLVHDEWLKSICANGHIPSDFIYHPDYNEDEISFQLQQSSFKAPKDWHLILIHSIDKNGTCFKSIGRKQNSGGNSDLSYSQIIHYITESNYRNLWKEANARLITPYNSFCGNSKSFHSKKNCDILREILKRLYCCKKIIFKENVPKQANDADVSDDCHVGMLPAYCIVETESDYLILHPFLENNLFSCLSFSPTLLESSPLKQLFIIYQLLNVIKDVHDKGLHVGNIYLDDIYLDESLWLQVNVKSWLSYGEEMNASCTLSLQNSVPSDDNISLHLNGLSLKADSIETSTMKWVYGAISNFEYLMILNQFAGRKKTNPNYYPVLPWIMDFTVPKGGWRDLSKSKFRLNKGDQQLDITFESCTFQTNPAEAEVSTYHPHVPQSQVPHHVSDVLSDITYYVYKARSTPKSILCQHVRSKWVPAEYPSSMQRLQEWTPDECIPEFFEDPSIFVSMHDDLCDLEIPWWAKNNEDFIARHRAALESDHVSKRIHHWIDLTYGYKLVGSAAISAKNVCLHLVDKHKNLTTGGVIQLFSHPHPRKIFPSLNASNRLIPLHLSKKQTKDSKSLKHHSIPEESALHGEDVCDSVELSRSDNGGNVSREKRKDSRTGINLSSKIEDKKFYHSEYNPIASLLQFESEYNFLMKSNVCDPSAILGSKSEETIKKGHNKVRDIQVLACLISEMYLAPKLRLMQRDRPLDERYKTIHQLLTHSARDLPSNIRKIMKILMQLQNSSSDLPLTFPALSANGLPPPSAHQLLQPLISGFYFPSYFEEIYTFLARFKQYSRLISELKWSNSMFDATKSTLVDTLMQSKIKVSVNLLSELLPKLPFEAVEIVIPFIGEMVNDPATSVYAVWELFSVVAPHLGPKQTSICFLPSFLKIFSGDRSSSKLLKLFHRSFLLQLIVCLHLKTFLTYFSTLLVEAVSGFKDFGSDRNGTFNEVDSGAKKSSFLCSPQLQQHEDRCELEDSQDNSPNEVMSLFENNSTSPESDNNNLEPEIFWLESPILEKEEIEEDEEDSSYVENESSSDEIHEDDAESLSENGEIEALHAAGIKALQAKNIPLHNNPNDNANRRCISASVPIMSNFPMKSSEKENQSVSSYHEQSINETEEVDGVNEDSKFEENVTDSLSSEYNISDVSMESIIWLAHRLGPVLTSKFLCRNLLRMLPLCYLDKDQIQTLPCDDDEFRDVRISKFKMVGDNNSKKIIDCLIAIATLYGEQIILLQYFPYISEQVSSSKKRVFEMGEAGILSGMCLLFKLIPYLSDTTLMDCLQEILLKDILYPVIQLVSSTKISFPGGSTLRYLLTYRLVDVLHLIGLRIGFEMARKHLSVIIHRFFLSFDRIPELHSMFVNINDAKKNANCHNSAHSIEDQYLEIRKNSCNEYVIGTPVNFVTDRMRSNTPPVNNDKVSEKILDELRATFTPELASCVYISFCKLAGGIFMEETLTNDEFIRAICNMQEALQKPIEVNSNEEIVKKKNSNTNLDNISSNAKEVGYKFGGNVDVIGNRINIGNVNETNVNSNNFSTGQTNTSSNLEPKFDVNNIISQKIESSDRHIRGNWLAYWEHEIGCSDKNEKFNFKQIKLQSFLGHSSSIKAIHPLDNENSFMTASKDRTVKLWSLRSQGDGSAHSTCQLTYSNHKKVVYNVAFLESLRLVGSCDGSIHLWDPFMGSCVRQFESPKNTLTNLLISLPPPSKMFLAATSDATLKFIDARSLKYAHEYKVNVSPAGLIRSMDVSPNGNWVVLGHSTGIISVLDLRNGMISSVWKGHEGEILQLKVFNEKTFVTSSLDYQMTVWNANDHKSRFHLKGATEPVTCLNFYKNQVISGTTANRIGVHTSLDHQASFSSVKLRSDTFKGVLTAATILPLNKLLLLGSDTGTVSLLC